MYMDWSYVVLVLPAVLFSLIASLIVKTTFKKYSSVLCRCSGAEAARAVLSHGGAAGVMITSVSGDLTDHFDPSAGTIALSQSVHSVRSVAAVGVAAHEAGHAIQHEVGYLPSVIRTAIVPVTNFGSKIALPLIIAGLVLESFAPFFVTIGYIGLICYGLCFVFQLVTLPVEFNASRRAVSVLSECGILAGDELKGAKKVLTAAALTYVAAMTVTLMQLLRFLILLQGGRSRRR